MRMDIVKMGTIYIQKMGECQQIYENHRKNQVKMLKIVIVKTWGQMKNNSCRLINTLGTGGEEYQPEGSSIKITQTET